jgi:hypothetical protein
MTTFCIVFYEFYLCTLLAHRLFAIATICRVIPFSYCDNDTKIVCELDVQRKGRKVPKNVLAATITHGGNFKYLCTY